MVPRTRNALIAAGLLGALVVLIVAIPKRHQPVDTADKLVGIWTRSSRPGHWLAIRLTAEGICEQAAFDESTGKVDRSKPWRWEARDDAILIYRIDPQASAAARWMHELYCKLTGPDQTVPILSLTDAELTVQGRDEPVVYQRVKTDPIFGAEQHPD